MQKNITSDVTVIGAGLTGLTAAFYLKRAGKSVTVVERSHRVGGVIRTFSHDGFTYEAGPNTGVLSSPELVQLFDDLGSSCSLETANPNAPTATHIRIALSCIPMPPVHPHARCDI